MPATNFEQQILNNVEYPITSEYNTYYPTWLNGQRGIPTTTSTSNININTATGILGSLITGQQQQQQQWEDVVLSGVSARFPGMESVDEFVQYVRGNGSSGYKTAMKNTSEYGRFAELIGEMSGLTMEKSTDKIYKTLTDVIYEAIFDAGMSLAELKGSSRVGVFAGVCPFVEDHSIVAKSTALKYKFATQLAQQFNFCGPVQTMALPCASSLIALDAAISAIKNNEIDYAIVSGITGLEEAYPAISAIVLTKKSLARRHYAKVLHSKVAQAYPTLGQFLREFYTEADIKPTLVNYIEAHLPQQQSQQHINAIVDAFGSAALKRNVPFYLGGTYKQQPSYQGLEGLIRMIVGIAQRGQIQRELISSVIDGRMVDVQRCVPFRGGLFGLLSTCGLNGAGHIILEPFTEVSKYSTLPRLVHLAANSQEALISLFEQIKRASGQYEQPQGQTGAFRGFTVLNTLRHIQETAELGEFATGRPVWLHFGGLFAEWREFAQEMMKLDGFSALLGRYSEFVKPYGLNLHEMIASGVTGPIYNLLGSTAVQMAVYELLKQTGVQLDGFVGQSLGELIAAYAEDALTAEEVLRAAYYIGKHVEEAQLPLSTLAQVRLSWDEVQRRAPVGIVPVHHLARELTTVAGPKRAVLEFIEQLTSQAVPAHVLDYNYVPLHTYQMAALAPAIKLALEQRVFAGQQQQQPKIRSQQRWISASLPQQRWSSPLGKFASADYFVNAIASPVLLHDAWQFVPRQAVVLGFGAMAKELFQSPQQQQPTYLPFTAAAEYTLEHFWTQLGRLFNMGAGLTTTGPFFAICDDAKTYRYTVDLSAAFDDAELSNMTGRFVYPTMGYLYLVWKAFAAGQRGIYNYKQQIEQFPVQFENVEFVRDYAVSVAGGKVVEPRRVLFTVTIQPSGLFELAEAGKTIVCGRVFTNANSNTFAKQQQLRRVDFTAESPIEPEVDHEEIIYRPFDFDTEFKRPLECNGSYEQLEWTGKWVPFLENLIQYAAGQQHGQQGFYGLPKRIRSIIIDPRFHFQQQQQQQQQIGGLTGSRSLESFDSFEFSNMTSLDEQLATAYLPLEVMQQWIKRFERQHIALISFLQQHFATVAAAGGYYATPEIRRYIDELERLVQLHQQQQQQSTGFYQTWSQVYERFYSLYQAQFKHHRVLQQIYRHVYAADESVYMGLRELIQELIQQHVECQIAAHKYLQQHAVIKQKLCRELQLVKQLTGSASIVGREGLIAQLEKHFAEVFDFDYFFAQRRQHLATVYQTWMQHLAKVKEIYGQRHQLPETLKAVVEKLYNFVQQTWENEIVEGEEHKFLAVYERIFEQIRAHRAVVAKCIRSGNFNFEELEQTIESYLAKLSQVETIIPQCGSQTFVKTFYFLHQLHEKLNEYYSIKNVYKNEKMQQFEQFFFTQHLNWLKDLVFDLQSQQSQSQSQQTPYTYPVRPSTTFPVFYNHQGQYIQAGGAFIQGITFSPLTTTYQYIPKIWQLVDFVPYITMDNETIENETEDKEYYFFEHNQQPLNITGQYKEFLEFYLNELKRYTQYILNKFEQPEQYTSVFNPTPIPKALEVLFERLPIRQSFTNVAEFLQGGKLLQLLIKAANIDSTDGSYFNKVNKLFAEKFAYWRALEQDRILSMLTKKNAYLRTFFETVFEDAGIKSIRGEYVDAEPSNLIGKIKLTIAGNEMWKVRDLLLATERLTTEFVERHRRIQQGKALVNLIENIKSMKQQQQMQQQQQQTGGYKFSPVFTYVIAGEHIPMAVELAKWLVECGVRKIVIAHKFANQTTYPATLRHLQEEFGAQIRVLPFDANIDEEAYGIIREAVQMSLEKKIGGIFNLIDNEYNFENKIRFVANLDKFVRGCESHMDENGLFVVFTPYNVAKTISAQLIQRVLDSRQSEGRHGLNIDWSEYMGAGVYGETLPYMQIIRKLEQTLKRGIYSSYKQYPVEYEQQQGEWELFNNNYNKSSLVEFVAKILGLNKFEFLKNEKRSLIDMGLDYQMAYEVKQWLENVYGLMGNTYTVRDVQQMTVEQLKSIEQARLLKKSILKRFNYLMPSRLIEKLNDVEYTQEHTPIVVLHPIEGHINMLKSWAKQFKYPVYGIQFTQEAMKYETVEQLASFYWQQIEQELLAKFGMSGVHLFGYNFGVPVAMEMAARKPSRIASLSLLDVAHPIMVNLAKKWLTVDETSIEALYTFAQQYIPTLVKKEFMQLLAKFTTLEQRVKYVVSELLSKSQFQFEPVDLEMAVRAFVHKYFLLAKYQPKQQQLRLPEILLIKSAMKNNCQWTSSFSDEYNFPQMLINGKIQTRLVDGDYRSIFEGQTGNQLATILNEYFLRYF